MREKFFIMSVEYFPNSRIGDANGKMEYSAVLESPEVPKAGLRDHRAKVAADQLGDYMFVCNSPQHQEGATSAKDNFPPLAVRLDRSGTTAAPIQDLQGSPLAFVSRDEYVA